MMLPTTEMRFVESPTGNYMLILSFVAYSVLVIVLTVLVADSLAVPKDETCVITLVDRVGVKHEYEGRIKPSLDN